MSGFNWDDHPVAAKQARAPAPSPAAPSGDFSWDAMPKVSTAPQIGPTEKVVRSVAETVGPLVAPIAETVDRFTGAPVRAAIGAAQKGENPAQALMNQIGADPKKAPTGREIAKQFGLSDTAASEIAPFLYDEDGTGWKLRKGGMLDTSAQGAAGLAIDAVADPTNVIGAGVALKGAKAVGKLGVKATGQAIKGTSIFADAVTGTKAATAAVDATKAAAQSTAKVAETAKASIDQLLKPSLAKDAQVMESVAQKHGIPKDLISPAHEFGDRSSITRLQKNIAEGALGEKYLQAHNSGIVKTSDALEKNITIKFGHAPQTNDAAGQLLKESIDGHISKVFDEADITYSSAAKQFPGIKIDKTAMIDLRSKAIGMKREAMRLERTTRDATQLSQAKNLREWSDLILSKADDSAGTYKEMSEVIQNVGKAAYAKTPVGQIPADMKKLRELYTVGSEALIHSIRKVDGNAAERLVMNNMNIKEMLSDKSLLGKVVSEAKNPEQVFDALVKRGGSAQIDTLKKVLPEPVFNQMRAKYLQDMVKYHTDDVSINFATTLRNMEKNSERLSYLFKPDELKDMTELLKFGERYGSPVLSSSGTGASAGMKNFARNLLTGGQDELALEHLKAKARGQVAPKAPAPASAAPTGAAPPPATNPMTGRKLLRERGPVEQRLKILQSGAPSTYKRPVESAEEAPKEEKAPPKGPEKWANDGAKKLETAGVSSQQIERLKSTPAGKRLLVEASDLTPGSKAWKKLVERIGS